MKKTLVIGSTVLDIIINVDKIPTTSEDVHIKSQTFSLGGCAYNVFRILKSFQIPTIFCSPVGSGIYGNYVTSQLNQSGISPFIQIPDKDNGCCYCFVESNGERTFLSSHGVEYSFQEEWLSSIDTNSFDSIYICGLEIEEPTGDEIISYLKKYAKDKTLYFAPGPRFSIIDANKLSDIFSLHPVLHLNDQEACSFTDDKTIEGAAKKLFSLTKNTVIITAGEDGSYVFDEETLHHIPAYPATVIDTIGAGDSHIGSMIASIKNGYSYLTAADISNKVSAKVVSVKGATLDFKEFEAIFPK